MTTAIQRVGAAANTVLRPIVASRLGSRLLGDQVAILVYRGRRSGRTVTVLVGWEPSPEHPDVVLVGIAAPEAKTWWRNFTGDGSTLAVRWRGVDRTGHAVARRDASGGVGVEVRLDPATD